MVINLYLTIQTRKNSAHLDSILGKRRTGRRPRWTMPCSAQFCLLVTHYRLEL